MTTSSRKRGRGEIESYSVYSTSYQDSSTGSASYRAHSSRVSNSVSSSRLLSLLDGKPEESEVPKAKKSRKETTSGDPKPDPEKRAARFKKACPRNILDRVERVLTQRFFMIERKRVGQELKEEFGVLGSTGNVYIVTIEKLPSCTCPDAEKGNHCKHILFIFLKVLQVPQRSTHWYQKALLTSELEEIFNNAPPAPNALASSRVRDAYAQATGKDPIAQDETSNKEMRKPAEGDSCPVCYEEMHNEPSDSLDWCQECRNALHKACSNAWAKRQRDQGLPVTCVWCRAPWVVPVREGSSSGPVRTTSRGYINLSGVAGLSPVRDASSYYHGPRRGQRYYGYQQYEDD